MHLYTSDDERAPALAMIAVAAVVLAVMVNAVVDRLGVGPPWLFSAPAVAACFGLLYRAMDTVAWRWPLLHRLGVVRVPVLQGMYDGELVSLHEQTTLRVRVCIDQTWTRIAIRLDVLAPTSSTSRSATAGVFTDGHSRSRLTYTYRNQVRPGVADPAMKDHDGTTDVVIDARSGELTGRYFTQRGTQGTLALRRVQV
ncbi:hypothetical protein [Micromonospora sp. NPDC005172]|uniref:Cap15 family cyclic dinucleotide receptor domain-containing protein n=1 Tax=Micromonospora sp. NPDC005172 TaxID=3156867 RepID=UPI0033A3442A